MHSAHVSHFSFPEVTLRVLSDHYSEILRNCAMKFWRDDIYKKVGRQKYRATILIPPSEKSKHALVTFDFHVAAGALVLLDTVTMQFLRGEGNIPHKDDAQLQVIIRDNQLEEVIFFYTTHVSTSHTYSSHFEHHETGRLFAYIDEKHQEEKNFAHWLHVSMIPGEETITFVSSPLVKSRNRTKTVFSYDKKNRVFRNTKNEKDEITPEEYIDSLQALLGMLPINKI